MSFSPGLNLGGEDNGKTVKIPDPSKPIFICLTGFAWTFLSSQSVFRSPDVGVSTSSSAAVRDRDHVQTGEFNTVRRYLGEGKHRDLNNNAAIVGAGGDYVFRVEPRLNRSSNQVMPGTKVTLTFDYARRREAGSNVRNSSIAVEF